MPDYGQGLSASLRPPQVFWGSRTALQLRLGSHFLETTSAFETRLPPRRHVPPSLLTRLPLLQTACTAAALALAVLMVALYDYAAGGMRGSARKHY